MSLWPEFINNYDELETVTISKDLYSKIKYAQHHPEEVEQFPETWFAVRVDQFPQTEYLRDNKEYYEKYFKIRHQNEMDDEKLQNQINHLKEKFDSLISSIEEEKEITTPIDLVESYDGNLLVAEGNHRTIIGIEKGINIPAKIIPTDLYIKTLVERSNQWDHANGTKASPYQPIYYQNKLITEGFRTDLLERWNNIDLNDVRSKRVVEFGSNLGSDLFLAKEYGATKTLGLEKDWSVVWASVCVAHALGLECPSYFVDLSKPFDYKGQTFDTGFCFSIDAWVKNNEALADNIDRSGISVLYFEQHSPRHQIPLEIEQLFITKDHIADTIDAENVVRKMYRLTR